MCLWGALFCGARQVILAERRKLDQQRGLMNQDNAAARAFGLVGGQVRPEVRPGDTLRQLCLFCGSLFMEFQLKPCMTQYSHAVHK